MFWIRIEDSDPNTGGINSRNINASRGQDKAGFKTIPVTPINFIIFVVEILLKIGIRFTGNLIENMSKVYLTALSNPRDVFYQNTKLGH